MTTLRYLLPFLGLLCCNFNFISPEAAKTSCDLLGIWSDISMIIDPDGTTHSLTFPNSELTEDVFLRHADKINTIYYSGQGNIAITPTPVLQFTKKRLSYKGTKLGSYKVSDQCSKIELINKKPIDEQNTVFAVCYIAFRHKNIIAMKQGKETVIYMRRDPDNPYFVGTE